MISFRIVWLLGCDVYTCTLYIKHLPKLYVILSTDILPVSCGNRPWKPDIILDCEIYVCINSWCCHQMETFSALLAICACNSPVTDEFPAQRPVTQSFGVFFGLHLNKRLSKQSWSWLFEAPSRPLWRHNNVWVTHNGHVLHISRNLFVAEWMRINMNHLCVNIAGTLGCVFIDNETHESGVTKCTTGEVWSAFSWHHSSVFHCQWTHNQVFLLLSHMLIWNAKSIFIYVMKYESGFIWKLGINFAVCIKWIDETWWNNRLLLVPNCYEVVTMVATKVAMVAPLWCHTLR